MFVVGCVWRAQVVGYGGFFFQAEDGIRDLVRSRGLGDVYKRQGLRGLAGIPESRELVPGVRVIRPMLKLSRATIRDLSLIHI